MRPVESLSDFDGGPLFEVIAEAMPTPLLVADSRCQVILANRASALLFGYSVREMLGMPAVLLVPVHQRPVLVDWLSNPDGKRDSAGRRELHMLRKDGSEFSRFVTSHSIAMKGGPATFMFLEELSTGLTAQDAEQQHMAALVESAEDAIVTKGLDGVIRSWNAGAERLLGYGSSDIIGQPITVLLPVDRLDEETMILDRIRRGQRVVHFETVRRRRDGSLIDVSLTISPIRDRSGAIVGASKVMRDITARKRRELELRRSNLELAQLNSDLDDFVYTASHDLRSPLTAVNSVVQWILEDDHSLSPQSRERLALIRSRIARMQRLLNDIRDYARSGRCAQISGPATTAGELVNDVAATLHLPPDFTVLCDPSLATVSVRRIPLEQIFHNLINNAIKHHDKGAGRVLVAAESDRQRLRFSVIDDGPGIPAEYKDAIFEMFKTLKPRDQVEGSGLGLALVRKIVGRLGGNCGVEPAGERGSVFWFDWPQLRQGES